MRVALDATYSLGRNLSGVGMYCRRLLFGLAADHPTDRFRFYYRPHRFLRSFQETLPANASRRLLLGSPRGDLFHALNQRADRRTCPTITTFHDLFMISGEYSSPEFRERFTRQARTAASHSDLIIAVSQFTATQVESLLGFPAERIRVIPHGVDLPPLSQALREKLILFVGAIQKRKNVARLIQAFEYAPAGWRLVLAGSPSGYGAAQELQALEHSRRRADIDVLGYVPQAQLDFLYSRASLFAFPSLDEGFGIPVLEAMAHGIPVITSSTSALPEAAGDAAILVDPLRVDEIGEAIARSAADPALCSDLAQRGRQRAGQFPWKRAIQRTWDVYHEIT